MPVPVCPSDCCSGCCKLPGCTDATCACDTCASGGEVCVGCVCQLTCSPGCTTGSCCNNGSCSSIHYVCNGTGGYTRVVGTCGSTTGLTLAQAQATCGGWGCSVYECIERPSGGTYGFGSKALCDDFYSTSGNCQASKGWVCCGGFICNSNVCDYTAGNAGTYSTHAACVDVSSTCEKTKWVCSGASPAAGQSAYTCYPYPGVGNSETTCKASCGTWKCLTPSGATVGTCVLTPGDSTGKISESLCKDTTCCIKQCYSCDSTTLTCKPSLCTGVYPSCGTDQGQCQLESNGCGTYSCNASNACQFQSGKGGTYTTKAICQSSLCEDTHWECSGSSPAAGKVPYTCYEYQFAASGSGQFTSETICKQQSSGCGTYECSSNTCVFRNGPTIYPFATSSACTTSGCGSVKYVCNGTKTSCNPVYGEGVGDTLAQCVAKCGTYTCDAGTTPSCSFKSLNGTGYTLETTCNDNCKLIYCCKGTCAAGSHPNCSKDTSVGCSGRSTYSTQVLCETAETCCGETHWECRLKAGMTDPNIPGNTECLEVDGTYTPGTNYQNIDNCKAGCGKSYSCAACTCSLITGLNGYDAFGICDAACPDMLYRCSNGKCVQDSCGGMTLETCKLTCGKYQCSSSVPVTSSTPCVFVSDTTTGYLTNTDCENNTYCRTVGRYVCTPVTCPGSTKPNGTICLENFTECKITQPVSLNFYSVGKYHNVATKNAKGRGFGSNSFGQCLGTETGNSPIQSSTADGTTDILINGLLKNIGSPAAGGYHTCSYSYGKPYQMYCWGRDNYGQCSTIPAAIQGFTTTFYYELSCGEYHSVISFNGTPYAWGAGTTIQTNGGATGVEYGQSIVPSPGSYGSIRHVSAGKYHTLATDVGTLGTLNGKVLCWGDNSKGQCNVPTDGDISTVAAGDEHSIAIKYSGSSVIGWGDNTYGQSILSAAGRTATRSATVIAAGGRHSLAIASGKVYGWGDNRKGQCLGTDSLGKPIVTPAIADGSIPVQIMGVTLINPFEIGAGDSHSYCQSVGGGAGSERFWGDNTYGQCDPPTETIDCTTPIYYDNYSQCDASACQDPIAMGNRWRCTANQCEFVPYCDGDGTYLTQDDCKKYCYGFNCKNNKCIQEAGASASVDSCNSSCIIKWKLNTDSSGCSTCVNIVGDQVIGVGTCCTKAADGSISCTPTPSSNCPTLFDTSVACQAAIIAQNLQPHACKPISATSSICVPLSEYPSGTCGTYCNKALCDIGCLTGGGSGYVCVPPTDSQGRPVSGKFVCELQQCGGTATYSECMGDCSARVSTGYNCVSTPSSSGSTFTSKCVSLQNPEDGIAQFSLLSRCKTFCLNNWGWTCKGNSCLKAWERPGQYGTQAECETFCVVPDQSPCGRVSALGQQRLLISSRGEQFDTYLDGSNPPEDPTVVPRNLFLTQNAQEMTSRIHDDGVFTSPDFIAGSCSEYPSLQLEGPYQKSYSAPCNSYTGLYNSNPYSTCTKYWNKKLTPNISEKSKFTTRSMHWLNGGYFYGESSLRKYIYNQDGTIHFNTSVKYDPIDSRLDSPMDYIPQIRHGNNKTFYSMLNDGRFTNGRIFKLNLAANSLGYNYSVFKLQTSYLISVIDYSMHLNTFTKNFSSVFTVRDEPLYSCGSITCIDSDVQETASVDNITVMLSTGNITHFPLSNENVQKTRHNRASFIMTDNIYDTFYFDLITETKNLYSSVSFPDNPYGLLKCDISDNSYNSYFINNSTQTTYPIVTSSVSLTDGTVDYGNFKFKCAIYNDPITNTPYLVLKDNYYYTLYDKYNEEVIPRSSSEMPMNVLDRILNYTKEKYPQVNIHTTLYACTFSNGLQNITLDKTKNILKPGTVYVSHEIIRDATDSREDQYAMRINLSNPIEGAKLYGSTSVGMYIDGKGVFMLMLKVSSSTSGYRNNTSDSTGSLISIDGNKYSFEDTNNSVILEKPLFAPNSSKFTTPDYTSIHTNTSSKILPLRGSEYSDIENNNYPTLRYIRKADGKFYIQILAGAFPYYHSIVHFPTLNELENCTPQDTSDNLCNKVVADSLLSVCSKNTDWYNHVATTKWVCHIKHTQFGDSPTEYSQTEEIKQKITGSGSKYVGKKPPTISGGGGFSTSSQAMNFNGTEFNPPPKTEFPEDFQL